MTCKINEKRVFSDSQVQAKLKELGVELVAVDRTNRDDVTAKELARADRKTIPVNIIYPADYGPDKPAILLDALISPADALEALEKASK